VIIDTVARQGFSRIGNFEEKRAAMSENSLLDTSN
jgi:hypothetical protein